MSDMDGWQDVADQEPDEDEQQSQAWGVEQEPEPENPEDDGEFVESFDPKWRNDFEGLVYLGHLEGKVRIPYHDFRVRTLKSGEKIAVTNLVQPYENSIGYARAYRAAIAGAGLVMVDGKPLLTGSKKEPVISQRYQYVIDNWHDVVIDLLYDEINRLEGKSLEILEELGIIHRRKEVVSVDKAEVTSPLDA